MAATIVRAMLSLRSWSRERSAPVSATVCMLVLGFSFSMFWFTLRFGAAGIWRTPADFWATYLAATAIAHGHLGDVYSHATALVTFPAISYLFAPVAAVTSAAHLSVGPPVGPYWQPTSWLVGGPFELLSSSVVIFATDAYARSMGLRRSRRWLLAFAEAAALTNLTLFWGHPEDAVALGLVLFGALRASERRYGRAALILGVAVAFQPLSLLAIPAIGAHLKTREIPRFVPALVAPTALLLLPLMLARPEAVWHAISSQPNYPLLNHATPFSMLLPHSATRTAVDAGPGRLLAVLAASVFGVVACRCGVDKHEREASGPLKSNLPELRVLLWAMAVAFEIRLVLEVTLTDFYVWPVLAVVMLLAATRGPRAFAGTVLLAIALTWFDQTHLLSAWGWWAVTVGAAGGAVMALRPPEVAHVAVRLPFDRSRTLGLA